MEKIETSLTKQALYERITSLTYKKAPFARGYSDKDCFVSDVRGDSITLMYHVINAGRSDGYNTNVIKAKVCERDDGRVDVHYSLKVYLPFRIFLYVYTLFSLLITALMLADWIISGASPEWTIAIPAILSAVGLTLLLAKPKRAIAELREQLYKICRVTDESVK